MIGGLCLCCLPMLARAGAGESRAAAVTEVQSGIFVRRGLDEDASPGNLDAIANLGFVVGRDAVAVIDPGGSLDDGRRLRLAIREVTHLPIRYVVMSHIHPDHIFGAAAFSEDVPVFIGHVSLPGQLVQRGEFYRRGLQRVLGGAPVDRPLIPTSLVENRSEIDLGNRLLTLHAHRPAHTAGDLSVIDRQTGILLSGDLLFVGRVPVLDGDLKGWLAELSLLDDAGITRVVPGHGPALVDWRDAAAVQRRYLKALLDDTRTAIAKGLSIEDAAGLVAQSERENWLLFDAYHPRNVIEAYRRLEWER